VREALAPFFGGGAARRARQYEPNPAAHDLYLKGRYAQARRIGGSVPEAIGFFEQSIAADAKYARAYSGLADAWFMLAFWGVVRPHDAIPKAKAAAQKALELDDRLAEAHALLGAVQCCYECNWDEGQRSIERGLELDPDSPIVNEAYATYALVPRCRLDQADAVVRKTISLDPYLPHPQTSLTYLLGFARRLEEAERQHAATIAMNPHYFYSHSVMSLVYFMNERYPEALEQATKTYEAAHGITQVASLLAVTHAANGNKDRAKELLSQMLEAKREHYVRATDFASVYCALRDRKQALAWLNIALEEKTMHLYFMPIDPRLRWLHTDPAFHAILDRIGLRLPAH
jgi:serine/threonine-protein kinase